MVQEVRIGEKVIGFVAADPARQVVAWSMVSPLDDERFDAAKGGAIAEGRAKKDKRYCVNYTVRVGSGRPVPHRQEEVAGFNWRAAIDRAIRGAAKSTKNMPLLIDKMRRLTTIATVCEYVEKDIKPESSRPLPVCPKGHTATLTLNGKPMEWIEVSRTELGR